MHFCPQDWFRVFPVLEMALGALETLYRAEKDPLINYTQLRFAKSRFLGIPLGLKV